MVEIVLLKNFTSGRPPGEYLSLPGIQCIISSFDYFVE